MVKLRLFDILCVGILCTMISCTEEDPIVPEPISFRGSYRVFDPLIVGEKFDSVLLTISQGHYSFIHYDTPRDFCDSEGAVIGYGTPTVEFVTTQRFGVNCDSLNVPVGKFTAVYVGHGDTIHMDRVGPTLQFSLRLLPE